MINQSIKILNNLNLRLRDSQLINQYPKFKNRSNYIITKIIVSFKLVLDKKNK